MPNKASKGSAFERWFCKELSLWWTKGDKDDVFWRTSNSGGRATTRSKSGKKTSGQYGDICATDHVGKPFTDLFTVELKRGYNRHSLMDLLDKPKGAKRPVYEEWVTKIIKTSKDAATPYWLIAVRRDRREPIVLLPQLDAKVIFGTKFNFRVPSICLYAEDSHQDDCFVFATTLSYFFLRAKPQHLATIKAL